VLEIETTAARRVATMGDLRRRGDYTGPHDVDDHGSIVQYVWFLLPLHEGWTKFDRPTAGSGLHSVRQPPWTFRECPDGSLEIRASIACGRGSKDGEYFHGYLDEGNRWRLA
jgi:hypothetical protein